jgi:hypothetical protein
VVQGLTRETRGLATVDDLQLYLARHMERLIRATIAELTVSGLDGLTPGQPYLFLSNHRDIVLDSGLLNYVIHGAGHRTCRMAVGDNLLSEKYAADLMRLNKSFMVERSVTGAKALLQALSRTSRYVRSSLAEGESVWIAQREGRAKDGFDRTDPALLKMLALAYRKEIDAIGDYLEHVRLVPVAVSYELDPCDLRKAHELCVRQQTGSYVKPADDDLKSIVVGLTGYKGRVHLHFGAPLGGAFETAEAMAAELDRLIVGATRVFPTNVLAADRLGYQGLPEAGPWLPRVRAVFDERLQACPQAERPFLLAGYANLLRNRRELGLDAEAGEPAVGVQPR